LNPVQELASGTPTANLLTGLGIDEFFTRTDSGGVRSYLTDALGSSVALADGSGTIQTEYTYEPFGSTTASGASSTNSFAYTGRESDGTGLHYYRARYYHPTAQRFIAEDPLGFKAGDANLHAYVGNAPTRLIDPTGEFAWAIPLGGCIGGALAMGASQGWTGRKLAKGCAIGATLGFGAAALGPLFGGAGAGAAAGTAAGSGQNWAAKAWAGTRSAPMQNAPYQPVRNAATEIGQRPYSGHGLDQMQNRGLVPSVVENAIQNGSSSPGRDGTTVYSDLVNGVTVVVNSVTGRVVTVW
jgi:RHS repeat-associated protein